MSYSGAETARESRESLGKALEALQADSNIPDDVMAVASNIAQSVGALFEAEKASSEPDGKACVKKALGTLSQTLALLQDVRSSHDGVELATETLAKAMSSLYPLTTVPSRRPPAPAADTLKEEAPILLRPRSIPAAKIEAPPAPDGGKEEAVEANIGANTESNFYVGFSGEIGQGGVFLSTYEVLKRGTRVNALVTLPGGFEFTCKGWIRFVRDPFDLSSDSVPGMGIQFEQLSGESRELVLRFIRKRAPMFFDE
ncbi:MAG: hypothetical protein ACI9KE_005095 [Polyangiales bacterium]|jgi:uncharacterized protein (TIGR02266 family)